MKTVAAAVTFPGAALHAWLHWLACRWFGLVLLRPPEWNRLEAVHEPPASTVRGIAECAGPAAVQLALGVFVMLPAFLSWHLGSPGFEDALFLWVGASLWIQAFPTMRDARSLRRRLQASKGGPVLAVPLAFFWGIGAGRRYGAHYLSVLPVLALLYFFTG